jgi:hypothetical protein
LPPTPLKSNKNPKPLRAPMISLDNDEIDRLGMNLDKYIPNTDHTSKMYNHPKLNMPPSSQIGDSKGLGARKLSY